MKKIPDLLVLAEHADLMKKLAQWDIAYHQNDAPIVDDATYDAARRRAEEIEAEYPELAKNGASSHVGAAVSDKFKSFPHSVPMLSISDVFNEAEVADWFNIDVWDKQAEFAGEYVKKGIQVAVEGRIQQDKWTDKVSGGDRERFIVVATNIRLLGSKRDAEVI